MIRVEFKLFRLLSKLSRSLCLCSPFKMILFFCVPLPSRCGLYSESAQKDSLLREEPSWHRLPSSCARQRAGCTALPVASYRYCTIGDGLRGRKALNRFVVATEGNRTRCWTRAGDAERR